MWKLNGNIQTYPLEQFDILPPAAIFRGFSYIPFPSTNVSFFVVITAFLSLFLLGFNPILATQQSPWLLFLLSNIDKKFFEPCHALFAENLLLKKNIFFFIQTSIAMVILFSNIFGMVPYSTTTTSFPAFTLLCSGVVFLSSLILGLYLYNYTFFSLFIPKGTPTVLKPALVLIELISYIARLFSLAIRLFANMLAGHALLKILYGFAWAFLLIGSITGAGFLLVVLAAITFLEFLIAGLQAYVFSTLMTIYLNESVNLH